MLSGDPGQFKAHCCRHPECASGGAGLCFARFLRATCSRSGQDQDPKVFGRRIAAVAPCSSHTKIHNTMQSGSTPQRGGVLAPGLEEAPLLSFWGRGEGRGQLRAERAQPVVRLCKTRERSTSTSPSRRRPLGPLGGGGGRICFSFQISSQTQSQTKPTQRRPEKGAKRKDI